MAGANDNQENRQVRDGFLRHWGNADFTEIATDEALARLADARNESSNSANKFMLAAALAAFVYLLRLIGIAKNLSIGQYRLSELPFGLFVLCAIAMIFSTLSLVRTGDSRAYDRQLRLACEKRYASDCHLRYLVFPNEKAWGEPFSKMASVIVAGRLMSLVRLISLTLITAFLMALVASPTAAGIDFLVAKRYLLEPTYGSFQFWMICFLTLANALTLILMFWARLADRE